jgi:hypothetical protein
LGSLAGLEGSACALRVANGENTFSKQAAVLHGETSGKSISQKLVGEREFVQPASNLPLHILRQTPAILKMEAARFSETSILPEYTAL